MFINRQMTGCERVIAALQGKEVDRLPVINPTSVATLESMIKVQAFFPRAHYDAQKMALLASAGHELLGFDTVAPYFSIVLEAAALGCNIDWGKKDTMPEAKKDFMKTPEVKVDLRGFSNKKPVKALFEAVELLKKRYDNRVAVVGKAIGPLTLAYHLYGVQSYLLKLIIEPESARKIMQDLVKVSLEMVYIQLEKGADVITWADHATSNLVSAACYKEYLLPIQQEATKELGKSCPIILHTCGDATDRFSYITKAGFTAFHFDSRNSLEDLLQTAKNRITLIGGINNPQLLLNGTPADIKQNVFRLIHMGINLVSPECAVPIRTPNSNLMEIVKAVKSFNRQVKKAKL